MAVSRRACRIVLARRALDLAVWAQTKFPTCFCCSRWEDFQRKKRNEGRLVLQGLLPTQKETTFFRNAAPRCFVSRSHRESVLLIGMDQGTYLHGSRQQHTSAARHDVHLHEARQPISNSAPDVFLQLFLYPLGPVLAEGRNDLFVHLLGVLGQVRQRVNRLQQRGTGQDLALRSWFHRKKTNPTTERETGLMGRACASPARQHKVTLTQQQHATGPRSEPPTLFSIVRYSTTRL